MIISRAAAQEAAKDPNAGPEDLIETANKLLQRQFISRADHGGAGHYDRVVAHAEFYKEAFANFGYRLVIDDGWGYIGYVTPNPFHNARVPAQETILLLCLRLLYNEGAEKGYFVDGADVLVAEDEIRTVFESIGSRSLKPGELREILSAFRKRGLVYFDRSFTLDVDVDVKLRPTLREVVDASFLQRLEAWRNPDAASGQPQESDQDEGEENAAGESS